MGRHPDRIALAREFGATDIVSERGDAAIERVRELTGGLGAHSVLECVGSEQAMLTAMRIARPGGAVGRVGVPHYAATPWAQESFYDNVTVSGGPAPVRAYIEELLPDVLEGRIQPGRVLDRVTNLDGVPDGYRAMNDREAIKVMISVLRCERGEIMNNARMTVLVVGATGSIGRLVVEEAVRQGHAVRALVRNQRKAAAASARSAGGSRRRHAPRDAPARCDGVDAVVFTHGSEGGGKAGAESVDYGGVRNVLRALGSRKARISLMTSIGVTDRTGAFNRSTEGHDWKRRSERLVRASGLPYTIVRPGWFDYNGPDEHQLVLLQGDKRHAGNPSDGAVARRQIAEVLVHALGSDQALRKTFELVAKHGEAPRDFDTLFAPLEADPPGVLDGVRDMANMPLEKEPQRVRDDLNAVLASR